MSVTIKDIALRCNVSAVTVSNALNGTGRVSEEKRQEILQVADELGYIPNRNARNLVKRVNGRIGLFVPSAEYLKGSAFFNNFLAGMLSELANNAHDLVLALDSFEESGGALDPLDVDGAIFLHPQLDDQFYSVLQDLRIPCLLIGRPQSKYENELHYVDIDNVALAYNTAKKLLEAGHKNNLVILGSKQLTNTEDHLRGIRTIYAEYGLELDDSRILFLDYDLRTDYAMVEDFLQRYPDTTGIITDSDTQALGLLYHLRKISCRVPEDLSVVCCSGTYQTELCYPPITGTTNPSYAIGVEAAHKIVDIIERKIISPSHTMIGFSIFNGKSVALPRQHSLFE